MSLRPFDAAKPRRATSREDDTWYVLIQRDSDMYRRRFLTVSLAIGLLLPLSVAVESLRLREYWNLPILAAAEALIAAGFLLSIWASSRSVDRIRSVVLALYPLAYLLSTQSPGSHQTYVIVLLIMPPIFDTLVSRREYRYWLAYAMIVVALAGLSFLVGRPSMWHRDFSLGGTLTVHASFFVLWVMCYVTSRQMHYYNDKLISYVINDPVTGLRSILALRKALAQEGSHLLCLVTIGNFGELSTIFGYSFTENVLKAAAEQLSKGASASKGSIYRLSHSDFAFLRPLSARESPAQVAQVFYRSLSEPLRMQDKIIALNYRIGYTLSAEQNPEQALHRANEAVKIAIEEGRDVAEYRWDAERFAAVETAVNDLVTLSRNVADKSFAVFYQPVVSLKEDRIAWNEALLRFKRESDEEGYEEPARYINLAASTGHWAAIEDFVLEAGANRALGGGGPVSFNAGLMDLDREVFVEKLERAARDARAAGSGIILELLEGDFGKADRKHLELIQELRAKGCLIALDDFGTGYSNYARASSFPLDIMKFDRALIGRAFAEKSEAILIGDLVQFCADRGVLTVAEGIETDHLADLAALMGFDFGQGFYWTRPLPELEAAPARMTSLLAKKLGRS